MKVETTEKNSKKIECFDRRRKTRI